MFYIIIKFSNFRKYIRNHSNLVVCCALIGFLSIIYQYRGFWIEIRMLDIDFTANRCRKLR